MLALAAPLPAFAISELAPTSEGQVAQLSVTTSLGSCGVLETALVCTLNVSFEALPAATGYSASVTRADGSVIDTGAISPGGSSIHVPYVGSGTYSVRVTAYGDPEPVEVTGDEVEPEVIATDVGEASAEGGRDDQEVRELDAGSAVTVESDAGPRDDLPPLPAEDAAEPEPAPECAEAAAALEALPRLPELPPEDLDPNNPDEDADTILDEQERIDYEAAVVANDEAVAQIQASVPADC
jgi:hypothetical protein